MRRTRAPQPSPRTKPLARASKGREEPLGEIIRAWLKPTNGETCSSAPTPITIAVSHSPPRMAEQARWKAVEALEQAVSTVMLGPLRL